MSCTSTSLKAAAYSARSFCATAAPNSPCSPNSPRSVHASRSSSKHEATGHGWTACGSCSRNCNACPLAGPSNAQWHRKSTNHKATNQLTNQPINQSTSHRAAISPHLRIQTSGHSRREQRRICGQRCSSASSARRAQQHFGRLRIQEVLLAAFRHTVAGICADRWRLCHSGRHMCRQVAFVSQ